MTTLREAVDALELVLQSDEHPPDELEHARQLLEQHADRVSELLRRAHAQPTTRDRVRELAAQKLTDAEIARRLGIRRDYVARLRAQEGISASHERGRQRTGWEDKLQKLLEQGCTTDEMAAEMGWSYRTVQTRVSDLRRRDPETKGGSR